MWNTPPPKAGANIALIPYATGRYAALRDTELAGGVDSDAETALLLRIEQTYAANARVLTAIDDMIRTLMEI